MIGFRAGASGKLMQFLAVFAPLFLAALTLVSGVDPARAGLAQPPVITSVSPTTGTTSGGTALTITGSGFAIPGIPIVGVTVGGVAVQAFTVVNDTTMTAITPSGAAGAQPVIATNNLPSNSVNFTYVAPPAVRYYNVNLSGAAESPPNASPGVGLGLVIVNTLNNTMTVSGSFSSLQGSTTASHIHAPTAVAGQGVVGVATTTPSFIGFPLGVTSGTFSQTYDMTLASSFNAAFITANGGTAAAAFAALATAIDGGRAYWNIHSTTVPGGEIRGFLTPTTGPINELQIPTFASSPVGIAKGPDGNLWFTESAANKIGRITPAGVITEFPLPSAGSQPIGIAAGPDGALWFAQSGGNRIGRITTAGVISQFTISTPSAFPSGIAAGPDGALWFTESNANKIGRITTGGVISEFTVPTASSNPGGIAAGPDGAMWFTQGLANKVARISMGGVFTEYALPPGPISPGAIALGPDNAMWFVELASTAKGIGRLTPPPVLSYAVAGAAGFDAGATSEILWRGSDNSTAMWFLSGGALSSGPQVAGPVPFWNIVGTGDFNGDGTGSGKRDILWRANDGTLAMWLMNGAVITSTPTVAFVPPDWSVVGVGDFDGDGKADILWRNVNGDVAIWLMNGATIVSGPVLGNVSPGWVVSGVGDFDGNGKADILWRGDRKSTRLNSSHIPLSRMPSSA